MGKKAKEITLTQKQIQDASKAISDLLSLLSHFPTSIQDFLPREELENIYRSRCALKGEEYDPQYYFDDEEDEDENDQEE